MAYIDGFVLAVPNENKQKFIDHAGKADPMFAELGATRIFECWGDDVPDGKVTDFKGAVQAKDDESVGFSWIEWPDKATRDAAMAKLTAQMDGSEPTDPRMDPKLNPMPFDGKRMIFGGFEVARRRRRAGCLAGYVDGFVAPVPEGNRDAYRARWRPRRRASSANMARCARSRRGATTCPTGKQTDFARAVKAEDGREDRLFAARMARQGDARRRLGQGHGRRAHEARRHAVRRQAHVLGWVPARRCDRRLT